MDRGCVNHATFDQFFVHLSWQMELSLILTVKRQISGSVALSGKFLFWK